MKNHILIPTDFSRNSWNALNYALHLYKEEECTFYLLNAFQLYHLTTDRIIAPQPGEKAFEQAKSDSEEGLQNLLDGIDATTDHPDHKFIMVSTYGTVIDSVRECVDKKDISMIVMGTKGERNPINVLYGSNATLVMEKINSCPVLVVPDLKKDEKEPGGEIVFATNFKFFYKRREIAALLKIASRFDAAIRILYVEETENLTQEQETNKEVLKDCLEGFEHSFHTLTNVRVAAGIHSFIESRGSDMLALYNRKHGFFSSLFATTLVREIGHNPEVPVLLINER